MQIRLRELLMLALMGCFAAHAAAAEPGPLVVPKFSEEPVGPPPAPWQFVGLSHQTKPQTKFTVIESGDTRILEVIADHSYGNLVVFGKRALSSKTVISWRWTLEVPNLKANLRSRSGDDVPIKVCVAFDYNTAGLTLSQRTALAFARSSFPVPVPIATLCYVWDHSLPQGTELANAFTDRIRYIVVESGESKLHSWVNESRNVTDDFWKSFGPEFRPSAPDELPGIDGVVVGADADNTEQVTQGEIGDITLSE